MLIKVGFLIVMAFSFSLIREKYELTFDYEVPGGKIEIPYP